jgi:hypothetical protein
MVFWVPMLATDNRSAAAVQADSWREPRVDQGWDAEQVMSQHFRRVLGLPVPAWDVYLLYPQGVQWTGELPPDPAFWMHQLPELAADEHHFLSRDQERLGRELDLLLEE